ncbi:MAG: PTS sugar transporter subunit IIA [Elusimicrobiaceae bacterium]|nr:PTS sugar transporter subunit IIA [Elusimicrobiaceae bacterium]
MKITDLLKEGAILLGADVTSKQQTIEQAVALMQANGNVQDLSVYKQAVLAREEQSSTGVGEGIAIPHAKTAAITAPGLAAMTIPAGVDYDSLDGLPVQLLFLIAAPEGGANEHLEILSRLSTMLMDETFRKDLLAAGNKEEFLQIIDRAEAASFTEENQVPQDKAQYDVLAVTACPTGIAHTFMAAEALEKAAEKAGISLKVETNGSAGIKNALTAQEIADAKCIIVAADKAVEINRFNGKRVIFVKVSEGIHRPAELLEQALQGDVPVFEAACKTQAAENGPKDTAWRKIYKYLMNGVSHMLPFVIGGGILIALSFLFDSANAGTPQFGTGNPLSSFLNQIGGLAFGMMFPILAGYIAMAIADRPALMPGMVGGFLAKTGLSLSLPQEMWQPSGFLGALAAGFLAGYIMLALRKLTSRLPASLEGIKPMLLYPFLGILAMGAVMVFVVNPPMAWLNTAMNEFLANMSTGSKVFLGLLLGGMMSVDFGGPINKTAYVFGTASLASQQYDIMAAVMAGGMVPPLAIALSTLFFKNRYTQSERQTTASNFVMGLSFITEGAIPFAAADPLRVIPSCAIGSAVAGALSMWFGCGSPAPHGGIFVAGVMTHAGYFVISLLAGALVGMVLLALLKKPLPVQE